MAFTASPPNLSAKSPKITGVLRLSSPPTMADCIPATMGTPQGAVISPLLAHVYLHYVLDRWVREWRQRHPRAR
jgi:hypothetical protein